jgi:ribosomal-protein-alanine N-acetyltransferase
MGVEAAHEHFRAMIRAFLPSDGAAAMAITRLAPEAAQWTERSYREALEWPGIVAMVQTDDVKVTGFILGRHVADEGEILNLAVSPDMRRRGEGAALLSAALDQFRELRVSRVFLEVRESNVVGIAFYERQGFCKKGRRAGLYHDPEDAAIVMERKLGD